MCVNYVTISRQLAFDFFRTSMEESDDWRDELYQDYVGPIIVHDDAGSRAIARRFPVARAGPVLCLRATFGGSVG